ncbi:epithelial sodium channel subunit delta [Rhinophrynus dorsalis]
MESTETKKEEGWIDFYDSFDDMFQFFCGNTTIHGTVRLNCSRRNKMKTSFWVVLFLVSFAMMYWQFGDIANQYWLYPTTTTIKLQAKSELFPAVTICNLNPYRFDKVDRYINQLDNLAQETLSSLYEYNASKTIQEDHNVVDLEDILANTSNQFNENFNLDYRIKLVKLQDNGQDPAVPGQRKFKVGFQLCNYSGEDCYYKSFWSGVDAIHEWYKFHFMNIMSKIPPVITLSGEDMVKNFIFACDFNGKTCNESEFTHFHHPTYGNCYTIKSQKNENSQNSTRPGKKYGVSLIVKAEQNDNMPLLSTAAGARVMIHNPLQPPLVEHEGFDIWPGTETSIRIRQDQVNHLGGKYSNCTSDGSGLGFGILYNTTYTVQACLQSCFQYKMIELCGCGYYFYPLPSNAEYCNYNKHPGWGHCFYRLYEKMLDQRLICFTQCPTQCTETIYRLSAGSAKWPSPKSKDWVIPLLSWQKGYNGTSNRSDVSKINIYYQEMSFQSFDDVPAMPVESLLISMGGLWSWWFGSSVLSVAEIAELIFDTVAMVIIVTYGWQKRKKAKKNDRQNGTIAANSVNQGPVSFIDAKCFSSLQTATLPDKELPMQNKSHFSNRNFTEKEIDTQRVTNVQ